MASFKFNGQTISYEVSTSSEITFSDGKKTTITGSVAVAAIQKAYKALVAPVPPIPVPPVVTPPSNSGPGIIITPAPGELKNISMKDYCRLSDVEGVDFKVAPGSTSEGATHSNLKDVRIYGSGKMQMTNAGITLGGHISNLTYAGLVLSNIAGYQISMPGLEKIKYTGSAASFLDGLTLMDIISENGGRLFHTDGSIQKGSHYGVVKGFRMLNSLVRNCPNPGSVVFLGNCFDYDIAGNVLTNINRVFTPTSAAVNGIHNGIFHLKGTGKFHDNKISNHQGNLARFWLHSIDSTKTVEAYNNFIYNSSKYGAFELQVPQDMIDAGAKFANAKINNNIAGQLGTTKDWYAFMLDLYNINGGSLEYMGNRGFAMNTGQNDQWHQPDGMKMINKMFDVPIVEKDNIYYPTVSEAMVKAPVIKSLISA
jgi:hypothetical protein